jgi:hypothetical protein
VYNDKIRFFSLLSDDVVDDDRQNDELSYFMARIEFECVARKIVKDSMKDIKIRLIR